MKCPYCGHNEDRVLDTREHREGEQIRRRRECLDCKARFSTVESLNLNFPMIIKKDGRREPFSKEKLLKGLMASCQKRPVSQTQLEVVIDRIATWVLGRGEKEISSRLIGQKVMMELRLLDDVAYVRFASVYRTFKDVQEFVETLEDQETMEIVDTTQQLALPVIRPAALTAERPIENASSIQGTRSADPLPN